MQKSPKRLTSGAVYRQLRESYGSSSASMLLTAVGRCMQADIDKNHAYVKQN